MKREQDRSRINERKTFIRKKVQLLPLCLLFRGRLQSRMSKIQSNWQLDVVIGWMDVMTEEEEDVVFRS